VQIRDEATGETIVTKVMRVGDTVTVPDRPGLTLLTGNAGGLEVRVGGVAAPAIGQPGEIVRDVRLDADSLLAGTATQ
jgi:cytoskeleton protein RodZ